MYTDLFLHYRDCYVVQDCGICVTVGMSGHPYKRADVMSALIINISAVQPFPRNVEYKTSYNEIQKCNQLKNVDSNRHGDNNYALKSGYAQ